MIRAALDRMALGERAVLAGVEIERVSLFGYAVARAEAWASYGAGMTLPHLWSIDEMAALLGADESGRGAEVAREPWELEVAGSIPAVQTEEQGDEELEGAAEVLVESPAVASSALVGGARAISADRAQERLKAGAPATQARIAELRRQHGRALRVTGGARAKRARWTKTEAWLVVSYPKEAI